MRLIDVEFQGDNRRTYVFQDGNRELRFGIRRISTKQFTFRGIDALKSRFQLRDEEWRRVVATIQSEEQFKPFKQSCTH